MNQRSQSAKPALGGVKQRSIQSALPKTTQYTRTQSGSTRIGSAFKSIATELFEVTPKEVIFSDIVAGVKYEKFVTIRNLTKHPCRIRVSQPKTSKFRVDFDMQQGIAAGLAMKVLIMFQSNVVGDFKDMIQIQSDEFQSAIRLVAEKPYPQYVYERFVDFGFVKQGTENTRDLVIYNQGMHQGKLQFKSELNHLKVVPTLINIAGRSSETVQVMYRANEMGNFRATVDIVHERGVDKLDVGATSVEYTRFLMDLKGSQVTQIDFGEFYIGRVRQLMYRYINNAPKGHQYKIMTRRGLHQANEELINLQTPNELGVELCERVIQVHPCQGFVGSYEEIELNVVCHAQLSLKEQMKVKSWCFSDQNGGEYTKDYKYSIIVQQPDEDLVIHVLAKLLIPMVKVQKQVLNFGECEVNDNKDILLNVSNVHNLAVDVAFSKITSFFFQPEKITIPACGQSTFQITFAPKNVGKYNQSIEMVLNDFLKIPIHIQAEVTKIARKRPQTRGPEARAEDFKIDPKFVDTHQLDYVKKRNKDLVDINQNLNKGIVNGFFADTQLQQKFKEQGFLQECRSNRLEKQRKLILQQRVQSIQKQMKEEDGSKAPKDYEFELGIAQETPDNDIDIPYKKDTLYVVKPIYQYEPLKKQEEEVVDFKPASTTPVKRLLSARPQSHKQVRDIHRELSSEDMKKIYCGPIKIDFGTIYVNSTQFRTFTVKNDLRYSIMCRMIVDKEELRDTYQDPQIIDSGQQGQFSIGICAQTLGQFKQTLKYILNERETFEILVVANVESVKVDASRTQIKFQFNEDSTQMQCTENVKLTNNGVGAAQFQFIQSENSKFKIEPQQGIIQANSNLSVSITYIPSLIMKDPLNVESDQIFRMQNPTRQDDEKIMMKVKDGSDLAIKCVGIVNDVKCTTKSTLEFKELALGSTRVMPFHIKNTSRNNAAFRILTEYLPQGCTVSPNAGKIAGDDNKEFTVKLSSNMERVIDTFVVFMLRSGRVLRIPLQAQCIIPNVFIQQPSFDFGEVTTLGNQSALNMTLQNNSNVDVELIINLQGEEINPNASEGVDCLVIKQQQELMKSFMEAEDEQQDQEEEEEKKQSKLVRANKKLILVLQGQSTQTFQLHFYPKEMKKYQFYFPIELNHYGPIDGLRRLVIVRGCQPKFIVEPKSVDFGRKIILTPPEKNKPSIVEILLSNPEYRPISFNIQMDDDRVFNIIPLAGRVDGGQTLRLKAMFNPRYDGQYNKTAQIYLEDSKPKQPYLIIHMSGLAAKPSIQYVQREILLTPVPLNIECRQIVRIYNDGFESQKLGFKQIDGFQVEFIEQSTVGITRQYLDILIKFQSSTATSITQNLEIVDETQHSYPISISGTADNCTLTTFPYLESENCYLVQNKIINEHYSNESEESIQLENPKDKYRLTQQMNASQLEHKCKHIKKWYNQFVGTIDQFPSSIVDNNGQHIFELITFLTSHNNFPFKANLENIKQKSQIVNLLYTQYKEMILFLKVDGALLNQIRPYYLLSYDDYLIYLKTAEPSPNTQFIHPKFSKLSQEQYEYQHKLSYLTLFYQILRIYYLPRVTLKKTLPDSAASNLYSQAEVILLRWIEQQVTALWKECKQPIKLQYNKLKDGVYLAALSLSYINGGSKYFGTLGQYAEKQEQDPGRNLNILIKAFQDVGVETHFDLDDFLEMCNPHTTLMLMSLYTQLPNFQPKKDPILFQCTLGSIIMKQITISNTSTKPLTYRVKLEGSTDFSIEEDTLKVEPGQKAQFNVKFTSRISDEQTAQITFSNKQGNQNIAAALVYDLRGIITERVTQKIWTVTSVLYEPKEFSIEVTSKFTHVEMGHYTVNIIPNKVPLVIEMPKKKKKAMSMAEKKKEAEQEQKEKQRIERLANIEPLPAFFCKLPSMRLKKNTPTTLQLQFIPTQFHPQKCFVVFQDPAVGEFQYEIHGEVHPPEVLIDIKLDMQVFIDQITQFSHHIPFGNPQLKQALKLVDQLTIDKKKILMRSSSATSVAQKPPPSLIEDQLFYVNCEEQQSYIAAEKQLTLVNYNNLMLNSTKQSEDADELQQDIMQKSDEQQNRINFTMNFKTAVKDYMTHYTLMNETKTDVRRIRITATSLPKPIKATLEMVAPAREVVQQDIPIVNNTDRDFNLKVLLVGDPRFSVLGESKKKNAKEQIIKKRTNGAVTVQFAPEWVCEAEATLQIINPLTSDAYEYLLKGKGEEPLSEGNYTIKAVARQPLKQTIPVNNPYEYELRYSVETDLPNSAGESEITIPPKSTYNYVLSINSVISGEFLGQITFTGNGHYRWWTLKLTTDTPKALGVVDLVSPIRKAIAFDIEIANPLPENITYEVMIQGEALTGDPWFSVLPGGSSTYQLVFQPLVEGRWKGSVAFLHPKMGEIWYQLNLIGEDRGGVRIPQFKTELGKLDKHEILLENPTGKPVHTEVTISNPSNFSLEYDGGGTLVLEPYSLKPVYVVFVPSALTAHSGEITIKTKEIGKWLLLCFGTGEPPTPFSPLQVICKQGQSVTQQIEFKNPLKEQLHVQLRLEQQKPAFEVLIKKNRLTIQPQSSLLIPYQFQAQEFAAYTCNLIIEMNQQVKWTYPIIGQIESELNKIAQIIQTKCRIPLKTQLTLFLSGLKKEEKVMYKIVDMENLKKYLKINLPNHNIKNEQDPLVFDIDFHPMKPFKLTTELQVKIQTGGIWKFKLQINALEPQVDDVIIIESDINRLTKVSFKLTNRTEEFTNFKAFFTPDSNQEFSVEPTSGMLEPFGKNGTEFKVGFKPKEYGKRKEAKLIIETEQMYWSYVLKGHLPKYKPPQISKTHVDDHQKLGLQHDDRNFIVDNLRIPRLSPPKHNNIQS